MTMVTWAPQYHDLGLIVGLLSPLTMGGSVVAMSPFTFLKDPPIWMRAIHKYRGTHTIGATFGYALCARKVKDEEVR